MTQALNFDRAARPLGHLPFTVPQRPAPPAKPLAVVPATVVPVPAAPPVVDGPGQDTALEGMIRAIGQATERMAELLNQLHEQDRLIADLQANAEEVRARAESAEAKARLHEIRAGEALLKVEQLQAEKQLGLDEHERLKTSVDTLLAMFGGEDRFMAASSGA